MTDSRTPESHPARADASTARTAPRRLRRRLAVYLEPRDIWVGVYVAESAVYVCPLPLLVFRWTRGGPRAEPAPVRWNVCPDCFGRHPGGAACHPELDEAPDEETPNA